MSQLKQWQEEQRSIISKTPSDKLLDELEDFLASDIKKARDAWKMFYIIEVLKLRFWRIENSIPKFGQHDDDEKTG